MMTITAVLFGLATFALSKGDIMAGMAAHGASGRTPEKIANELPSGIYDSRCNILRPLARGMLLLPPNAAADPGRLPHVLRRYATNENLQTTVASVVTTALVEELDDTTLMSGHALLDHARAEEFCQWIDGSSKCWKPVPRVQHLPLAPKIAGALTLRKAAHPLTAASDAFHL